MLFFNFYVDELSRIPVAKVWKVVEERFVLGGIDNPTTGCTLRPIR